VLLLYFDFIMVVVTIEHNESENLQVKACKNWFEEFMLLLIAYQPD